ncbi:MAG: hypothetical protein ACMG6E_08200 [Candidatus Roizmanbacteria bacterium]
MDTDYFKYAKITSMKGPYIIGVYGRKKSTYTISLTAETYPMAML